MTSITFSNQENETIDYVITPDVSSRVEDDGDCTITNVQPYIFMQNELSPEFLQVWFQHSVEVLSEYDQLWAIVKENDENQKVGAITDINNPDAVATAVTLNGTTFDDVITFVLDGSGSATMTIYLQKNEGIVGYEYNGVLWVKK